MRIGLLAPPWFPVPPDLYGGTEAVVSVLAEGLVARGHDVTLFASGGSRTSARLVSAHDEPPSLRIGEVQPELLHVLGCLEHADEFDLVHDHTSALALCLAAAVRTPFVHTMHGPLDAPSTAMYDRALRFSPRAWLTSLTEAQRRPRPGYPWLATCANGIEIDRYPFRAGGDGYVAFLGRMCADKGPHLAIPAARAAGVPLVLAGKCREPAEQAFFDARIRPLLGPDVTFVGELGHDDKVALLRDADALLCPIDWEEPFGLVLIESLACGTPVVATRRGSVPEVIVDGVTGIVVERPEDAGAAVARAVELDPFSCREDVERRFTAQRMVQAYEAAYERCVAQADRSSVARQPAGRAPTRQAARHRRPTETAL